MKRYLLLTVILAIGFAKLTIAQQTWSRVTPLPQENDINHMIKIPGTNTLIAAASNATLMYSDDAGETWNLQLQPAGMHRDFSCKQLFFIDSLTGFVAGSNKTILKTDNGGESWRIVHSSAANQAIGSIYFSTALNGFATSGSDTLLKTSDGGDSWQAVSLGDDVSLSRIAFADSLNGFILNYLQPSWLVTHDGGLNWEPEPLPDIFNQDGIHDIIFVNDSTGFVAQDYDIQTAIGVYIYKTTDKGANWNLASPYLHAYSAGFSVNGSEQIAMLGTSAMYESIVALSNDGGESWQTASLPFGSWFARTLTYLDGEHMFAGGSKGYLFSSSDSGLTWEQTDQHIFKGYIRDMEFLDALNGYLLMESWSTGVAQTILNTTTDGGKSWEYIPTPYFAEGSMSFPCADTGFILGTGFYTTLFRTFDKGQTWEELPVGNEDLYEYKISFYDSQTGIIVHDYGILKTNDGGETWEEPAFLYPYLEISKVEFHSPELIYMCGRVDGSAFLFKSEDGGINWQQFNAGPYNWAYDMSFAGDNSIFLGCFSSILKSTDGGGSWVPANVHINGNFIVKKLSFPVPEIGYATIGYHDETLLKTIDGGENWYPVEIPVTSELNFVFFTDELNGLFSGANGLLISTETGGVVPVKPKLNQDDGITIYPNPFIDEISFGFPDGISNLIKTISVYDVQGRKVFDFQGSVLSGSVKWSAKGIAPGFYFARISTAGGIIKTFKIIKASER